MRFASDASGQGLRRVLVALAAAAVGLADTAEGPVVPALRQGLWSYERVAETPGRGMPRPVSVRKCIDPTADMKKNLAELKARGCTVASSGHQGNEYSWSIECSVNGSTVQMSSLVIVESPTAFREEMSSQWRDQSTKSILSAHRLGDCSAPR